MFLKEDEDEFALGGGSPAPVDDMAAASPELVKRDPNDIEEQETKARLLKGLISGVGGMMQGQANVPSAFEMLYGKRSPRADFQGTADGGAALIGNPIADKQKAMEYLKSKREAERDSAEDAPLTADQVSFYEGIVPSMKGKLGGMTARQFKSASPLLAAKFNSEGEDRRAGMAARERAAAKEDSKAERAALDQKERTTSFGVARTADDAKKVKEAGEIKADMDSKIQELIQLREKYGAEAYNREAVTRAKQLSKELLLQQKQLAGLGVLSKTDMELVNEMIPDDPLQFNWSSLVGQDPTMTKLKSFQGDTNKQFNERLKNRIESGAPVATESPSGGEKTPQERAQAALERKLKAKQTAGR